MVAEPNAWLVPQPQRNHAPIWSQSGTFQVTPTIRYNSQRIMAVRTPVRTLGVNTWFSLCVREGDPIIQHRRETALALWLNATLGMLLQANRANITQQGRGIGDKGMLEKMPTFDVRKLQSWQLDEARSIWRDFRDRSFQSFHRCAVDPARIELDRRVVRDLLGLGEDGRGLGGSPANAAGHRPIDPRLEEARGAGLGHARRGRRIAPR